MMPTTTEAALETRRRPATDRPYVPPGEGVSDALRCRTLVRVLRLKDVIASRQVLPPLSQLADRMECCERTIRRDLEVLRAVGIQVPPTRAEYEGDSEALIHPRRAKRIYYSEATR
jgi:hypothetical protein